MSNKYPDPVTAERDLMRSYVTRLQVGEDPNKVYEDMVGYNPAAEGDPIDRDFALDYVREYCFERGIHTADVGITQEIWS